MELKELLEIAELELKMKQIEYSAAQNKVSVLRNAWIEANMPEFIDSEDLARYIVKNFSLTGKISMIRLYREQMEKQFDIKAGLLESKQAIERFI